MGAEGEVGRAANGCISASKVAGALKDAARPFRSWFAMKFASLRSSSSSLAFSDGILWFFWHHASSAAKRGRPPPNRLSVTTRVRKYLDVRQYARRG